MAAHHSVEKLHLVATKAIRRLAEQRIPCLTGRDSSRNVVDEFKGRMRYQREVLTRIHSLL
jgi:hypothetical protein